MTYQKYKFDRNLFNAALAMKGLTQQDLAKKLGITRNTLINKLMDNGRFNVDEIVKMYQIFGKKTVDGFLFNQQCAKTCNVD